MLLLGHALRTPDCRAWDGGARDAQWGISARTQMRPDQRQKNRRERFRYDKKSKYEAVDIDDCRFTSNDSSLGLHGR